MGAEVFYSTALPSLDLRQLAFAGSNYILIEFPTTMHPPGIDETLYAIRAQGTRRFWPTWSAIPL